MDFFGWVPIMLARVSSIPDFVNSPNWRMRMVVNNHTFFWSLTTEANYHICLFWGSAHPCYLADKVRSLAGFLALNNIVQDVHDLGMLTAKLSEIPEKVSSESVPASEGYYLLSGT